MKEINIAMATDDNYVFPTSVAIKSVVMNKKDENLNFYVFYINLKNENKELLQKCSSNTVNIRLISIKDEVIPNLGSIYVSKTSLIRLFIYKYLPIDVNKILWLDGDILALDSLMELYDTDIENYYFAGYKDAKIKKIDYERLNLNLTYKYINVGVLLINISKLREFDFESMVNNFVNDSKYVLSYLDQDIINKLFLDKNKIKVIDNYNRFNKYADMVRLSEIKRNNICLLHYEGPHNKPWKGSACRHYYRWWSMAIRNDAKSIINMLKVLPNHVRLVIKKTIHKIEIIIGIRKMNEFYSN